MKRSIERSGSPPRKRYSPYTSPARSPRVRSPSGSVRITSPAAGSPRVGSPTGSTAMVMSPPRTSVVPKARTTRKEEHGPRTTMGYSERYLQSQGRTETAPNDTQRLAGIHNVPVRPIWDRGTSHVIHEAATT